MYSIANNGRNQPQRPKLAIQQASSQLLVSPFSFSCSPPLCLSIQRKMAFWGVSIRRGRSYTYYSESPPRRFKITHATMDIGFGRCNVECKIGDNDPVQICSLSGDSIHLNLEFEESEDVVFSVRGPVGVHLSGYYVDRPLKVDSATQRWNSARNRSKNEAKKDGKHKRTSIAADTQEEDLRERDMKKTRGGSDSEDGHWLKGGSFNDDSTSYCSPSENEGTSNFILQQRAKQAMSSRLDGRNSNILLNAKRGRRKEFSAFMELKKLRQMRDQSKKTVAPDSEKKKRRVSLIM